MGDKEERARAYENMKEAAGEIKAIALGDDEEEGGEEEPGGDDMAAEVEELSVS